MTENVSLQKKNKYMPYIVISGISFLVTVISILIVFAFSGMAPFGERTLLYRDGEIQMIDLFCWFKDVILGRSSIDYTFTKSLGGSNYSVFTYYLSSPFSLLIVFFGKSQTPLFMNIIYMLKTAFAAAFMGIYLKNRFAPSGKLQYLFAIILSVSYALNPFFITQSSNIMWLDGAYMLPLILLGAEKIAQKKKSYLLPVTVALALCFNWYSGIIDLMFACFWYLFELIRFNAVEKTDKKDLFKNVLISIVHFALSCICSLLIASAILVPTLMKLSGRTHGKGGLFMLLEFSLAGSIPDTILDYSFGMISIQGNASLFAGSFVLIGIFLLFMASSKTLKEKIIHAVLLIFTILMFVWQPLVALFSMLRVVESFWYRYSYLGVFTLVFLASGFYLDKNKTKLRSWMPLASAAVFSVLVICLKFMIPSRLEDSKFAFSLSEITYTSPDFDLIPLISKIVFPLLIAFLLFLMAALKKHQTLRYISLSLVCFAIAMEFTAGQLILANLYSVSNASSLSGYSKNEEALLAQIKDDSFYRAVQTSYHSIHLSRFPASYNEPMAYGFNSVTSFISDPDENTIFLMDRGGYAAHSKTITTTSSENLALDSLLGVKYVILPSGSSENTGLDKLSGIDGFKDIYVNPYSYPAAFVYGNTGSYESTSSGCPALYINDLNRRLTGIDKDLFIPAGYTVSSDGNEIIYTVDLGDGYDPEKHIFYANIPTDTDTGAMLLVNGQEYTSYSAFLAPSFVRIPSEGKDVTITIKFDNKDCSEKNITGAQFYLLDISVLKESSDIARGKAVTDYVLKDGYGRFSAESTNDGESLFVSVPLEKGWTITRNGQKVECDTIGDTLISVPLEKGTNIIEMKYRVPYKNAGLIMSSLGIVILAGTMLIEKFKPAKRKKDVM